MTSDVLSPYCRSLAVVVLVLSGCATTPKSDAARAYLDRAEPLHCEVAALEARLKTAPEGSAEAAALSGDLGRARARVKAYYQATWPEYVAMLQELPFEERKKIYAYSDAVGERCAAQAGKGSTWR